MTVRRTLPQRARSLIGAWCFADHYGPDDVAAAGGMDVPPHPHTGLQTVSWLFAGEIEHRDSLGTHAIVQPGELNLMTGGHGICHSEVSTAGTPTLHGVQLWVALPDAPVTPHAAFHHHAPPRSTSAARRHGCSWAALAGETSPVPTYTPLLGAEIVLDPRARVTLAVDPGLRARRPGGHRAGRARRRRPGGPSSATSRPAPARWSWPIRASSRAGRAAGWCPVRRGHRDVVELRRPHPRGDRRPSARPGRPSRPSSATSTATAAASACPRRRCPPPGSRHGWHPRRPRTRAPGADPHAPGRTLPGCTTWSTRP